MLNHHCIPFISPYSDFNHISQKPIHLIPNVKVKGLIFTVFNSKCLRIFQIQAKL